MARQWDERSKTEEALLSGTGENGLVFSSFRFDNPKTVARGDWITVQISNIYNRNGISDLTYNPSHFTFKCNNSHQSSVYQMIGENQCHYFYP